MAHDFVTCHELKQKIYIFIYKNWYIKFIYIKDYIYIYININIYIYIYSLKFSKSSKLLRLMQKVLNLKQYFRKNINHCEKVLSIYFWAIFDWY